MDWNLRNIDTRHERHRTEGIGADAMILTYREVAEQLGISPDTVKKHISKALHMLREEMNK